MGSILNLLDLQSNLHSEKLLYAYLNISGKITESYTYQEFVRRTNDIAAYLHREHRLSPGDRVLLAYPPGLEIICAFFACAKLGLIPVPVYPPASRGFRSALYKMTFIAQDCGAVGVLTDRSFYWSMRLNQKKLQLSSLNFKADFISKLKWIVTDDAGGNNGESPTAHSDVLFLQYTSGSTSNPKGVMVTHNNIIHNCDIVVDHLPIGVSWLPQYHDMGLIGYYLFFALKGGTTYGFSPIDFIERPALWLETITKHKGSASSAPNFAFEYCLRPDKIPPATFQQLDLSSLRFLMTAAEPVRSKTYADFIRKFEPYGLSPKSFFSAYGLAEFTLAVSNYGRSVKSFHKDALSNNKVMPLASADGDAKAATFVSCGRPLGNTEIRIVDAANGLEAKNGSVGEIWIDGDSKCKGYWNRPELSKVVFEATGSGALAGKSWLRTGDLGFIHDGELFLCGRTKDLIIIRGQNYYPHDVETVAEANAAIRKGCVAALACEGEDSERLVVVAELKNVRRIPDPAIINKHIFEAVGIRADEIIFVRARTIPKTSSGKIARHQVRALYLEGKLQAVGSLFSEKNAVDNERQLVFDPDLLALFRKYNLAGTENETLTEAGLDSLMIAGFVHDLKSYLSNKKHGDLMDMVEARLVMKISIADLFSLLHDTESHLAAFKFQFKKAFSALRSEFLKADRQLMAADAAPIYRTRLVNGNWHNKGHILLTSGTGFFGPFLLKSLLEQTSDDIFVMVRADSPVSGKERLVNAFQYIRPDQALRDEFNIRTKVVCGDLSQSQFGLEAQIWNFLSENIHTIYHNGAHVNYLFDYNAMRRANVGGTNEVINLAWTARPKIVNHISTTFIFGWSTKETLFESDNNDPMELLDFGYSQSKWVSEQLIRREIGKGLRARIFRPALLSPSIAGGGINMDISIRLLAFMLKHSISTTAGNQVSFTPADIAANNIVAISNIAESVGLTFHVTRDEYSAMRDITTILGELNVNSFRLFSLKEFVPEVVSRCGLDDPLFPLLDFLVQSADNITSMEFKRYDNSNYRRYRSLSPWGKEDPALQEVVSGILRFMEAQGLVTSYSKQIINA